MFEITVVEETVNQEVVKMVNARDLHAGLGVGSDYYRWLEARIEKYGFAQDTDFITAKNNNCTEYHLTLDMAKELCVIERTTKGKKARQYFIKMQQRAMAQLPTASTDIELKKLEVQLGMAQIELEMLKLTQNLEMLKLIEETKQLEIVAEIKRG